ncbi:hypothetical protein ACJO2E_03450 [Marinobacter sp. M1N3S26]|uniref:hypothetical protein n=1 Tax=Marinobacter sp. M1N3S26 TaxID=3382299 RepID=UPI00387AD6A4
METVVRILLLLIVLLAAGPATGQDRIVSDTGWADTAHQLDVDRGKEPATDTGDAVLSPGFEALTLASGTPHQQVLVSETGTDFQDNHRIRAPPFLDHRI